MSRMKKLRMLDAGSFRSINEVLRGGTRDALQNALFLFTLQA